MAKSKDSSSFGGFTPQEMAKHAAHDTGGTMPILVTCADEREKTLVQMSLKGLKGAALVDVVTLDEYDSQRAKSRRHVQATSARPVQDDAETDADGHGGSPRESERGYPKGMSPEDKLAMANARRRAKAAAKRSK